MKPKLLALLAACGVAWSGAQADEFGLAANRQPVAIVHAPGENLWAGRRLADRLEQWTGARLTVVSEVGVGRADAVAIGTPESNAIVREVLTGDDRVAGLGDEGYILKVARWRDRRVLIAGGKTLSGANNAVSELVSWRLKLVDDGASVPSDLNISERPALKYRLLWNWTMRTTWPDTFEEMHAVSLRDPNQSPCYAQAKQGFLTHFKRAIDYFSDHKLNGLIIWHFLHDHHGGAEAGREIAEYAKRQNVRLLPGIGTVVYGGFYSAGQSPYSVVIHLREHPQQKRAVGPDGKPMEIPCSGDPAHRRWLEAGTRWFFETFPDVGGANLEQGDFHACHCTDCKAQRALPENDPNCFWDMMYTQTPLIEVARQVRPDAWMTFATYCGFRETDVRSASYTGTGAGYPPRFLQQYPESAICQWTLSHMVTPQAWPAGAKPPPGRFQDHIGLLHDGSGWDRQRWWADLGSRGASLDDASQVYQFICGRLKDAGMAGLVVGGEVGAVSPANELNYVAFEYFAWHPGRTWEQFVIERLAICYGGAERAQEFVKMLRNTSRDIAEIEQDRKRAEALANAKDLDVRQRARWRNLANELARRAGLAAHPTTQTGASR